MEKPVRRRALLFNLFIMLMVPKVGLEPTRESPLPPQDSVSTSSTTSAHKVLLMGWLFRCFGRLGLLPWGALAVPPHRRLPFTGLALDRGRVLGSAGCRRPLLSVACWLWAGGVSVTSPIPGGFRHVGQRQRGQHEDDGRRGRGFAQKSGGAGGSEQGLTGAAAEGCSHIGAFAGLKQNDHNQRDTNDDMNDQYNNQGIDMFSYPPCQALVGTLCWLANTIPPNESGFRLAPPTRAPSMSGMAISSEAFSGFTLPPYRILTTPRDRVPKSPSICERMISVCFLGLILGGGFTGADGPHRLVGDYQ